MAVASHVCKIIPIYQVSFETLYSINGILIAWLKSAYTIGRIYMCKHANNKQPCKIFSKPEEQKDKYTNVFKTTPVLLNRAIKPFILTTIRYELGQFYKGS